MRPLPVHWIYLVLNSLSSGFPCIECSELERHLLCVAASRYSSYQAVPDAVSFCTFSSLESWCFYHGLQHALRNYLFGISFLGLNNVTSTVVLYTDSHTFSYSRFTQSFLQASPILWRWPGRPIHLAHPPPPRHKV